MEKLVFATLEPVERDVEIGEKQFRLVELDVPDVAKYKSAQAASIKFDEGGGMQSVGAAGELDPMLVSMSLKEVKSDGSLGRVSRAFVDKLHPTVVRSLADAARDMNPALFESPGATVADLDKQIARLTEVRDRLAAGISEAKN